MIAKTIEQAREAIREAYPFSVDMFRLSGPENMRTPHFGLFRSDTQYCLPVAVKKGFEPHTVDDIEALTEAVIIGFDSEQQARITCHWSKDGHRVIVAPTDEYRRSIYGTKDNIFPRAVINAPFGRSFSFEWGLYRDACKNLSIPQHTGLVTSTRIRHTSSLRTKMDELIRQCRQNAGQFDKMADMCRALEARKVATAKFLSELYPLSDKASDRAKTQHRNRAEKIISRMLSERVETGRPGQDKPQEASLWELVNAVTGYVQWDKTRHARKDEGDGRTSLNAVDRAIMGVYDNESADAWKLAAEMMAV